jgi:hypothetical protein
MRLKIGSKSIFFRIQVFFGSGFWLCNLQRQQRRKYTLWGKMSISPPWEQKITHFGRLGEVLPRQK